MLTVETLRRIGVLALAIGLAGCGSLTGTEARTDGATVASSQEVAPAVALSKEAAAFFGSVADLELSMEGTPEQRATADWQLSQQTQEAYATCMSGRGFHYAEPEIPLNVQEAFYTPDWWAPLDVDDARRGFGYAAPPAPIPTVDSTGYESLSSADRTAYDAALTACQAQVDQGDNGFPGLNPTAQALADSLEADMAKVTEAAGFQSIRKKYATCMSAAGIEVRAPSELYDVAEQALIAAGLYARDPYSDEARKALPDLRNLEATYSIADLQCRASIADELTAAFSKPLHGWVESHETGLQEAAGMWPDAS